MGNALRNASRFEESLECYAKALELKPDYADAHNNLGIAYAELGRFDEAVASYTRCLKVRPGARRRSHEPSPHVAPQGGLRAGMGRIRMALEEAKPDPSTRRSCPSGTAFRWPAAGSC